MDGVTSLWNATKGAQGKRGSLWCNLWETFCFWLLLLSGDFTPTQGLHAPSKHCSFLYKGVCNGSTGIINCNGCGLIFRPHCNIGCYSNILRERSCFSCYPGVTTSCYTCLSSHRRQLSGHSKDLHVFLAASRAASAARGKATATGPPSATASVADEKAAGAAANNTADVPEQTTEAPCFGPEASGISLRGVCVSVSPIIRCRETWGDTPSMLKGPVAYEATVVTRLKSAGAIVTSGVLPTTSTYTDGAQGRLEVTARPPIQRGVTWKAHASGSTSSSCVFSEQRQTGDARASTAYRMGFSPSKGSVSLFGCFSAADVLRRDRTATVAPGNVSPLLQASCGTPALWICGEDVVVLQQIFRALKAADPCDLQTFRFYLEQAQRKTTSMKRRDIVVCPRVTCLQVTGNEESTAHLPLALERHDLLERLQQLQQTQQKQKQSVGSCRNLAVACIAAQTLQRASVGQALLQCCEAAGLLLRIGQGGTQEPLPSHRRPQGARQGSRHQGQQEEQEQQHNRCFKMNVLSERAKAFSLDVRRKILLGGVLLQDRGRTDLLHCARIAQQEIREHLDSFFTEADALLHFAETSESNLEQPLFDDHVSASETVDVDVGPHIPTASPHGVAPNLTPSRDPRTTFRGVHEQLLAVVTAAGFPCFVSADGWLLLGSRGSDEVVLKLAAALAKK